MGSKKDNEQQTGGSLHDSDENRQQILKPGKCSTAASRKMKFRFCLCRPSAAQVL
jgi:hypothetical protein